MSDSDPFLVPGPYSSGWPGPVDIGRELPIVVIMISLLLISFSFLPIQDLFSGIEDLEGCVQQCEERNLWSLI